MTTDEKQFFDKAFIELITISKWHFQQAKELALEMLEMRNEVVNESKPKEFTEKVVKFDLRKTLLANCFNEKLVDEWLLIRKNKKATNTETAFKSFMTEVYKTKLAYDEVLKICIENSWKGFKAEWLNNNNQNPQSNGRAIEKNR